MTKDEQNCEIVFATTNNGKIHSMRKWVKKYGIKVSKHRKHSDFEKLIEPQEGPLENIARQKALFFRERISKPLVVQDSGFFIKSLGGFPGHLVKPILSDIGIDGLLKLVGGHNRDCFFFFFFLFLFPLY